MTRHLTEQPQEHLRLAHPITLAMLRTPIDSRDKRRASRALRLAFNTSTRGNAHPAEVAEWLRWFERNSRHVSDLADPDTLRKLLSTLDYNHDGSKATANTVRLRRTTLKEVLDFTRERKLLQVNPMTEVKTRKATTSLRQIDRRSVANPVQARTLLKAVEDINGSLAVFFALLYFAALRPEEATNLGKRNLALPDSSWGEIHLEQAAPAASGATAGLAARLAGIKHREDGVGRTVPCSPGLTAYLNHHLRTYGRNLTAGCSAASEPAGGSATASTAACGRKRGPQCSPTKYWLHRWRSVL